MKKQLLSLFCLFSITITQSQTQIGSDIDGEAANDQSGFSISISSDGSVVAIGAPFNDGTANKSGHVRIYENIAGVWTQVGADIDGEAIEDESGYSVSLSSDGSVVAIGAPKNIGDGFQNMGHVRVYENIAGVWTQVGSDINGEAGSDLFGHDVSLSSDGSVVAISAILNDGNGSKSGHVRVYENLAGVWTQVGSDIDGEMAEDQSGGTISLSSDGSVVAIGAGRNDGYVSNSGHVRVYEFIGGEWTQVGTDIDGEAIDDYSGIVSLSADGSILAIGALYNDGNGLDSGHVRVYENLAGVWTQIGSDIDGESVDVRSGIISLSSDGSVIVIGAPYSGGHVRVYKNISSVWTQVGVDIEGEVSSDRFGIRVSLSSNGSALAVGATQNDGNGTSSGHVRVFDLSAIVLSAKSFELDYFTVYPNPVKNILNLRLDDGLE